MIGPGDYNGAELIEILLQKDNGQAAIWLLSGFSLREEMPMGRAIAGCAAASASQVRPSRAQ